MTSGGGRREEGSPGAGTGTPVGRLVLASGSGDIYGCKYIRMVCVSGVSLWSSVRVAVAGTGLWDVVSFLLSVPLPFPGCCLMLSLGAGMRDPCLLTFPLLLPAWLLLFPFPTSCRLPVLSLPRLGTILLLLVQPELLWLQGSRLPCADGIPGPLWNEPRSNLS